MVVEKTERVVNPGQAREHPDGLPQGARGRAMLVVLLGIIVMVLDTSALNLALPTIARTFQATPADAIWVINANQLATLVMLLPMAVMGERLGYRRVYLGGMALFATASLGAIFAPALGVLVVARALQGLGVAGVLSVNVAIVRLIYPRASLGRGLSINSATVAMATVAGPSLAAGILSVASWHWLFVFNVPLGLLTLWLGRKALPVNPRQAAPTDAAPFSALDLLLHIGMFMLVFLGADALRVARGSTGGAVHIGWLLLGAGLVIGAWHVVRQSRRSRPLFPVDLLRLPVFALSMGTSVSAFCAHALAFLSLPFLLLEAHGRSAVEAGLLMTAWPLAVVSVAPIAGWLIGRYPDGLLGGVGMAICASGMWLLAWLPQRPADWQIVLPLILCGAGFALFQSPNNHTIVTSTPLERSGAGSAMVSTARLTGQTLGAIVLATLFALWPGTAGTAETFALAAAGCLAVVAGICSAMRVKGAQG